MARNGPPDDATGGPQPGRPNPAGNGTDEQSSPVVSVSSPRQPRRRFVRVIAWIVGGWLVLTIVPVLVFRFVPPPLSMVMLEAWAGAKLSGDHDFTLRYDWTPWARMSKALPLAVIAAEDQRFPFHHGFDFDAIHDAIEEADEGERLRGASTISQQTAKNLFLWQGRSFIRKGLEAWFTVLLEALWPKQRILEVYCNIAEFGRGIYGAGAASQRYFHEPASRIDLDQAARLAAVLPNPIRFHVDRPSPYVQRRAEWIIRQADQLGGIAYVPR